MIFIGRNKIGLKIIKIIKIIFITLSITLYLCSNDSLSGGFGSETTNGRISGKALLPDGRPAAGARVSVRRTDFVNLSFLGEISATNPRTIGDAVTDSEGAFLVDSLDTGSYFVEINDNKSNAVKQQCDISSARSLIQLDTTTLLPYSILFGRIDPSLIQGDGYVQIVGLDRLTKVDSTGCYTFSDLPSGAFEIRVVATGSPADPVEKRSVSLASGQTITVPPLGRRLSARVFLNTTASGAGIYGSYVTNFPLLLRLDESVFDFSGAASDGSDLLFTKYNGIPLHFEIERWEALKERAEVWVLIDTVYPNDSSRYFLMYWGSDSTSIAYKKSSVFDSASGFLGVWHLNGDCIDASNIKHNPIACSASDTEGIIGYAKRFNGTDSIKIAGLMDSSPSITISAWAKLDSVSPRGGGEIFSIGDAALLRMDYFLGNMGTVGSIHLTGDSTFYNVSSGKFLKQTGWHFLTYTIDHTTRCHTLYIDGEKAASRTDSYASINYSGVGKDTYIGKHGNGKNEFNFIGEIDEVRLYNTAVSADYVKLCYMNQKQNGALTVFK